MPARFERFDAHPHVALITLDRPERANALDLETLRDLAAHWQRIDADDTIRVAILTGSGRGSGHEESFCAGMDMHETIPISQALARGERVTPEAFEGLRSIPAATLVARPLRVPLVAAINGHARAGGFDLLLAAQIRYAVPRATFALEEVALGLYPTGHATVVLPREIAGCHAAELLLTGRPIDAERARSIGLLNEIVSPDALRARAFETADQIARNAPLAVQATLGGMRALEGLDRTSAYERQEALGRPLRRTEDAREAQRAFVERRPARFVGR